MSKQKKYHYIYKTTCKITGKFYVGMHSTDNLEDGYLGSGKILGYSRHKYGDENHVREILEYLPSRIVLKEREKEIVNEELLAQPLNINLKYGGDGGWDHLNDSSPDHLLRCRAGGKIGGPKTIKNNALKITKSSRLRGIETAKKNNSHFTLGMLGKVHSDLAKNRMSASGTAEKNSQFGTCWVTNGVKPIKIKKENLDEYLSNGYSRGRTIISPSYSGEYTTLRKLKR